MARRRHHEVAGFAYSHEIADHFRMRDSKRPAGLDLRLEFGHDRAVRGEHVAEAHCDQSHGSVLFVAPPPKVVIERLTIHLGKALRGTEHGYRLDRLVGRDHYHSGRAGGDRSIGDIDRTEDVRLDRFLPLVFEQRHVLERRGVEYDIWPEHVHQTEDAGAITNV